MSAPISILIPSRNELFLAPTIRDCLEKASGEVEVIATLDGYWPPDEEIVRDRRIKYVHRPVPNGMRAGINAAAAVSQAEFLFKLDGHCLLSEGYDTELASMCKDNWVVVPRRLRLDAENWCEQDVGKPPIDYMYLSYPEAPGSFRKEPDGTVKYLDFGGKGLNGKVWPEKNNDPALRSIEVDDLMSAQGSGWFMPRAYFYELELMDESQYGTFWSEFQEIGLKCWLSGGEVKVNKRCSYAHLHKGSKYGRGYRLTERSLTTGAKYTMKWMLEPVGSAWHKAELPLSWLIEKFWPVPGWPEDRALWSPTS